MYLFIVYEQKENGEYVHHSAYFEKKKAEAAKETLENKYNRVHVIPLHVEDGQNIADQLDWLQALEEAGVDNWSGYDFAIELFNERRG